MEIVPLTLAPRTALGKKTHALRREGLTPVHIYGHGVESKSLQAPTLPLIKALAKAGRATPLSITVEGGDAQHLAFVREIQWHPVNGSLLHVDFLEVRATERVQAEVPLELVGKPAATGLTLVQHLHSVTVEALPLEMPQHIEADLALLTGVDHPVHVKDLKLPAGVSVVNDQDDIVVALEEVREEEPTPVEAEAAAEGAEPEAIKQKGPEEAEEGGQEKEA